MNRSKNFTRSMDWKLRKYSRWVRRYMKRVRIVEQEIGGEMDAC